MVTYIFQSIITFVLLSLPYSEPPAEGCLVEKKYDENVLKKQYLEYIGALNYIDVATDYRKAVKDLLSDDTQKQIAAVKTLGQTGQPYVIPWIVPFLDSCDSDLRISAAYSIKEIVSSQSLKRRDMSHPEKVVLEPLSSDQLDMKPLAWLVLQMFRRQDDGNTHAYAAIMTRYLELTQFEDELRDCLKSRHPAVKNKAQWALESLGLSVDAEEGQTQTEKSQSEPKD